MDEKELLTKKLTLITMNDAQISTKDKPIIGTEALATCIGVLLYNEEKKLAIVAHIAPSSIEGIEKIFKIILDNKLHNENFKYLIIPGYYEEHYNTKELIEKHLSHFTPFKKDEIPDNAIKINRDYESKEFAFNASTGNFVTDKVYFGLDYQKINNKNNKLK